MICSSSYLLPMASALLCIYFLHSSGLYNHLAGLCLNEHKKLPFLHAFEKYKWKKMNKLQTALLGLLLLLSTDILSQDSLLIELIKANAYAMQLEEKRLSGPGFDFLDKAGQTCPFFLIGESHGIAEIPKFTAALFQAFKQHGYRYYAAEVGPYTARYLQNLASQETWEKELKAFLNTYPWSIPFFSLEEEGAILDCLLEQQETDEAVLWGLDQEFAAGFRMNLDQLQKKAKTETSREIAATYFDKAMQAYKATIETGDPGKSFMAVVRPDDFEDMKTAFAGQSDNLNYIRELQESLHIYQLWFQRKGYESNRLRAEMMKRHFWDYYKEAREKETRPKVMIKLGASHTYRGANGLNVFDIGNFISEVASQEDTQSFHLYIIGKKGTRNAYTPFSRSDADKQAPVDAAVPTDKIDLSSLLEASPDSTWSVIDLLPLRKALFNKRLKHVDSGFAKIIWSYDAILMLPQVTAATLIE